MALLDSMFQLTSIQSILIGLIVGYLVYYLIRRARYHRPPTPFAWPLIGHLLELRGESLYKLALKYSKEYGPVVNLKLGPMNIVTLNNKDVVLEALLTRKADFAGRPFLYSMHMMTEGSKDIVFGQPGPTWKLHRKIASSALRRLMTGNILQKKLYDAFDIFRESLSKSEGPVDVHHYNTLLVHNVISAISFGQCYQEDDDEYKKISEILDNFNQTFGNGFFEDIIPPLRYWPTKKYTRLLKMDKDFRDILTEKISKHEADFDRDNIRDFIDTMIAAKEEAKEEESPELLAQITDAHLRQTVNDIFNAGVDTTRYTLDWVTIYAAKNPELQKKVYKEIISILGKDRRPTQQDRAKAPYTVAFIEEAMRIRPIAVLAVPHAALCDSTIGGYDIEKGTTILINLWALHMDPAEWEEPEKFNPDRFLENGQLKPKPDSFLPFSAGRRVCLGEPIAKVNLFVLVASILQKYEIIKPNDDPIDTEPTHGATMIAKPFKVIYKLRQ